MIETKENLTGSISTKSTLSGKVNQEIIIIQPTLQEKNATPTEFIQEIIPDENYQGLSKVIIQPIPDEYVIPSTLLEGEY